MKEEDNNPAPTSRGDEAAAPGNLQDYGFPAHPTVAQRRCWQTQERFLEAFAKCGSVGEACLETGIPVGTQDSWDQLDSHGFKKRKAMAAQIALGYLEREIRRRAVEGTDHPVIYKGAITATYKEYSDLLLMFRTKRLDPGYRDNYAPAPGQFVRVTQIIINAPPGGGPSRVLELGRGGPEGESQSQP